MHNVGKVTPTYDKKEVMKTNNKEILKSVAAGDKSAFDILFKQFYAKVHRFVFMLLKNNDDADDVSQMIFTKLWMKRERLASVNDFDSYLFVLSKYTTINFISASKVIPIDVDTLPDVVQKSTPHDDVVAKDMQLLIDMVVENMPTQRQTIYRMSREQHMKNEDIANKLGLQKKTVENHLNLALKEIKKAIYIAILLSPHWV